MIRARTLLSVLALFSVALASGNDSILPSLPIDKAVGGIRAQIIPVRSTILSSGVSARVAELSFREGDRFERGDTLLVLDCALHRARLEKAKAVVEESLKTWEVNARLGELNSVSTLEVDVAAARLAGAKADLAMIQIQVNECEVHAPFSGRMVRLDVKRYQYVPEGQPLFELIDDSDLEVEMIVPSRWLQWLSAGSELSVYVEELSSVIRARVSRIGARIDPVSQSVKVFASLEEAHPELVAGMSGTAQFPESPR